MLQGFAALPEVRVHVVSCTQQPMRSPEKLAGNIWFHSLHVPKLGWLRTGYQGCIRAVRRKLRAIQPDLVHGQGTERDCALSAIFSSQCCMRSRSGSGGSRPAASTTSAPV